LLRQPDGIVAGASVPLFARDRFQLPQQNLGLSPVGLLSGNRGSGDFN
jgi:hypothetical protein